jgi:predicted SnoaL-like aldol condensation-catalyzing enzyme
MNKTNTQIVREYIEEVYNNKHFDRVFDYCSQDCIIHNPPYVGLGINFDDRSGKHIILTEIAPNSPAAGILKPKDELIRVKDTEKTWETFKDLKSGMWGQGVLDTSTTVTVKRAGKLLEIPLKRGRVEGFNLKLSTNTEIWRDYILKFMPDGKTEIKLTCAEGDLVAFYAIDSGTNLEYHHSAVWDECGVFRLKDGKIIEMWGVENGFVQMKQMGYQIIPPAT